MLVYKSITLAAALALIGLSVAAQQQASAAKPSAEHQKLAAFVGTWKDEAEMKPSPLGPGGKIGLTETCGWFAGGFSVVCHTETVGSMDGLKTLTVLTYDSEEKVYRFYEFNSAGRSNSGKGTVNGDIWTFEGESKIGNRLIKVRTTINLPSPNSAVMKSEASVDSGPMTLLMELKGTRAKQSQTDLSACVPHGSEGWPFELFECYRRSLSSH